MVGNNPTINTSASANQTQVISPELIGVGGTLIGGLADIIAADKNRKLLEQQEENLRIQERIAEQEARRQQLLPKAAGGNNTVLIIGAGIFVLVLVFVVRSFTNK